MIKLLFYCLLLLNVCHMHWYEQRYNSVDWRLHSKTSRPFFVGKARRGVYTIKRGTQTLHSSTTQCLQTMGAEQDVFNLMQCHHCSSKQHLAHNCPVHQCTQCAEFGHDAQICKKNNDLVKQ